MMLPTPSPAFLLVVGPALSFSMLSASGGFIDMDTPIGKRTTSSLVDGSTYHLASSTTVTYLNMVGPMCPLNLILLLLIARARIAFSF
jgi:hypothetical protein